MATREVTFVSKYTRHKVLRRPPIDKPLGSGGWVPEQSRVRYDFEPGLDSASGKLVGRKTLTVGQDKLDTDHSGTLAPGQEFGVERDAVEFMMAHRAFGKDFWLEGFPPGVILPRPQEWRATVRKASVSLDEEALVRMVTEERRTHGRPDLISEAEDALALVREALAEVAAAQEAEAAKAPKAKTKAPAAA